MNKIVFAIRNIHLLPFYYIYLIFLNGYSKVRENYIKNKFEIHPSVMFWHNTHIYGTGKICIDNSTYIGQNSFINAFPQSAKIKIGKKCSISHNVHIRTADNKPETLRQREVEKKWGDIEIGDNVWIGAGVFIRGGGKNWKRCINRCK